MTRTGSRTRENLKSFPVELFCLLFAAFVSCLRGLCVKTPWSPKVAGEGPPLYGRLWHALGVGVLISNGKDVGMAELTRTRSTRLSFLYVPLTGIARLQWPESWV